MFPHETIVKSDFRLICNHDEWHMRPPEWIISNLQGTYDWEEIQLWVGHVKLKPTSSMTVAIQLKNGCGDIASEWVIKINGLPGSWIANRNHIDTNPYPVITSSAECYLLSDLNRKSLQGTIIFALCDNKIEKLLITLVRAMKISWILNEYSEEGITGAPFTSMVLL